MKAKSRNSAVPNGVVIYRGPSQLDGKPIIAIATGLARKTNNAKTGAMVQTWIIREDIPPTEALRTGDDASVCGDCPLRGTIADGRNVNRACYVMVWQAPNGVWTSYHRGIYPMADDLAETFRGRMVRIGSYGDPAAVPLSVWREVLQHAESHTGYTHQWRRFPEFAGIVMASADTKADRIMARMLGFRTFRVTGENARIDREAKEFVCPSSKEAGNVMTCQTCKACGGKSSRNTADVVISVHGSIDKTNAHKRLSLVA